MVQACPECSDSDIVTRKQKRPRYLCRVCGATFAVPAERPPLKLADRLSELDPDAVGREGKP